jgi:hypothetical protein
MEGKPPVGRERRAYFRVIYPEDYHPTLSIRGIDYPIIDICEIGVRFKNPEKQKLPGDIFQATVLLHDNDPFTIVGRVIRVQDEEAAMMMTIRGIPYRRIIAEQAYLRQLNLG